MASFSGESAFPRKVGWLPSVTLAVLILLPPCLNLSQYWLHNPLYGYGAWAPLLAAFLLWKRGFGTPPLLEPPDGWGAWPIASYFAAVPFLRVAQIANPDWRLLDWLLVGGAVAALLALVRRLGGPSLLSRCWLPVCLLLTAAPWPTTAERALTDAASPVAATAASEVLWTAGLAAVDEGRTLRTAAGPVSVGEDCSGIRGVQLSIMASFFWAAFYFLNPWRTVTLLLSSVGLALLLNVLRVAVIAGTVIQGGSIAAGERVHDLAGGLGQLLLILGIPLIAMLIRPESGPLQSGETPPALASIQWTAISGKAAIGTAVWLLICEASAEAWFRLREVSNETQALHWMIHATPQIPRVSKQPLPSQIREAYNYSDGFWMSWGDDVQTRWSLFWLYFDKGKLSACIHNSHRPEVCLPYHDCNFIQEFPNLEIRIANTPLVFRHQLYSRGGDRFHLFYTTVEETGGQPRPPSDWGYTGRLTVAWKGIRANRTEMIHLLAETSAPPGDVRKAADEYLKKLLLRTP